jgi:hypothetical protein
VTYADFATRMGQAATRQHVPVSEPEFAAVFSGVLAGSWELRLHTLRSLVHFPFPAADQASVTKLWVATCDPEEANAALALDLWTSAHATLPAAAPALLVPLLGEVADAVVPAVSKALGAALTLHASEASVTVAAMIALYRELVVIPEPTRDVFGNLVGEMPTDRVRERVALMQGFAGIAAALPASLVPTVAAFCVDECLFDRSEDVQVHRLFEKILFKKNLVTDFFFAGGGCGDGPAAGGRARQDPHCGAHDDF